jgi:hypothetical protein
VILGFPQGRNQSEFFVRLGTVFHMVVCLEIEPLVVQPFSAGAVEFCCVHFQFF